MAKVLRNVGLAVLGVLIVVALAAVMLLVPSLVASAEEPATTETGEVSVVHIWVVKWYEGEVTPLQGQEFRNFSVHRARARFNSSSVAPEGSMRSMIQYYREYTEGFGLMFSETLNPEVMHREFYTISWTSQVQDQCPEGYPVMLFDSTGSFLGGGLLRDDVFNFYIDGKVPQGDAVYVFPRGGAPSDMFVCVGTQYGAAFEGYKYPLLWKDFRSGDF